MTEVLRETDVFVVGGGPAGLAAAIEARTKGFRVVVAIAPALPLTSRAGKA